MKRIGERIKKKRELRNFQLNDLAKKVGISSSALSQIENAKAFPSLITLKSIAENLYTTVGDLIGENETLSKNPVIRKDEMKFVERNQTGTEIYLLSHHDINKQMDTYFLRFPKGADSTDLIITNSGQHFCYITDGEIIFYLESKKYTLNKGDSIYFNAKTPHNLINESSKETELILVISPPNY